MFLFCSLKSDSQGQPPEVRENARGENADSEVVLSAHLQLLIANGFVLTKTHFDLPAHRPANRAVNASLDPNFVVGRRNPRRPICGKVELMTSQKQIDANRKNALRSTGPKTEIGRSRSSVNARTHGLTARRHILLAGEEFAFKNFRDRIVRATNPQDAIEEELADGFAVNRWRRHRADAIEDMIMGEIAARELDRVTTAAFEKVPPSGRKFETFYGPEVVSTFLKIARYRAQVTREARLDLHDLERIQARRKGEPVIAPAAVDHTIDTESSPGQDVEGPKPSP